MAELTPFGKAVRKLRIDRGLRLIDLAEQLEQSAAFISAVETGRKQIPKGFGDKIAKALGLTDKEARDLGRSIDQTRREVNVESRAGADRELIAAFARRLNEVPDDVLERIKKIVLRSRHDEIPFRRKRRGFVVPAKSQLAIRHYADEVRSLFVAPHQVMIPIVEIIEWGMQRADPKYVFDVREKEEMGDDEGLVPIGGNTLILRIDVYKRACEGSKRDRFTAGHELAHYLMHRQISLARTRDENVPIYRDSEWQADVFAGALFMPAQIAKCFSCAEEMAEECGVSNQAATVMWAKYEKEGLIR